MLLSIFIALTIAMFGLLFLRFSLPCMGDIHWSQGLALLALFSLASIILHTFELKCWRFLTWKPQRLRSVTDDDGPVVRYDVIPQIVLYIWSFCIMAISICKKECGINVLWPILSLICLLIYTASVSVYIGSCCASSSAPSGSSSASSESDSEPSSVKTSDLDLELVS